MPCVAERLRRAANPIGRPRRIGRQDIRQRNESKTRLGKHQRLRRLRRLRRRNEHQRSNLDFAEIVFLRVLTRRERNPHDRVVAKLGTELVDQQVHADRYVFALGRIAAARDRDAIRIDCESAQQAWSILVVGDAVGLNLDHGIRTRRQTGKVVISVGVGRGANRAVAVRAGECYVAHDRLAVGTVAQLEHDARQRRVVARAIAVADGANLLRRERVVGSDRRAVDVNITGDFRGRAFAEVVVREVLIRADGNIAQQIRIDPRAAAVTDVCVEIEVAARLMLADRILARPQVSEQVLAVGIGVRRGDDVAVRVEQVDRDAGDRRFAVVGIAFGISRHDDLPANRAGLELAEVVLGAHFAPVDHDHADHVARRRDSGDAAQVARRVDAVEPTAGMDFHHRVLAGPQVVELVETGRVGGGAQDPCRCRCSSSSFTHDARDAFFRRAVEHAVVRRDRGRHCRRASRRSSRRSRTDSRRGQP